MVKVTGDLVLIVRDNQIIEGDVSYVTGKVITTGAGFLSLTGNYVPLEIKEGDTVYFRSNAAEDVSFGDEHYSLIRASDIHAIK